MKRVIVTGATGFVGANLTHQLLQDGHQVHVLVRPNCNPWRLQTICQELHWHEISLSDRELLMTVVSQIQPDWIFHLAVHGAYSSQTDLLQMVQTNFVDTIHLVEACLKVGFEAFVNTGSSSEYGFKQQAPSESEWLEPNSHYAITKASATLFCRYTAQSQKVHIPTLRLYSVYGPYEEPTRLMPTLIARGLQGELPPLVNPEIARDYVYTEDVNQAYILAASQSTSSQSTPEWGAVYNVGTGIQTRLREVVEVARRVLHVTAEPNWGSMPDRHWDASVWVADSQKIQTELGWSPRYSFEQGFRLMADWFQQHSATLSPYYGLQKP